MELVIGSPCCQLVADDTAVCDDLTETQLQVNLPLRRRERERERAALPWLLPPPEERERWRRETNEERLQGPMSLCWVMSHTKHSGWAVLRCKPVFTAVDVI